MTYDTVLSGGLVVDPQNNLEAKVDIGIQGGKVVDIGEELDPGRQGERYDVSGYAVLPGIVDMHVHTSRRHKGQNAHRMMARAGVVTALDMGGPVDEFMEFAASSGAGLNMAVLQQVRPGLTIGSDDPSENEVRDLLDQSLKDGAIGLKILGGHYPLTPEATRRVIEVCNTERKYVAFHSGTTRTPGNIEGFLESVNIATGLRLHIPHINSYCRGASAGALAETTEALNAISDVDNLFTESYLATINGTSGRCIDGEPESHATRRCLEEGGFPPTEQGLAEAISAGFARVGVERAGENINITGEEAVRKWRQADTVISVNFPLNSAVSRFLCAVARDEDDRFIVDAISTDGGGHPRNVAVEHGLALVRAEGLSLSEFVHKACWAPAAILGLPQKGQLGIGADADITVVDVRRCKSVMSFNGGTLIMHRGVVVGEGTRVITSPLGEDAVKQNGLEAIIGNLNDGAFYGNRREFGL